MGRSVKIIIAIIVVAVVAGGAFWLMNKSEESADTGTAQTTENSEAAAVTISYTDSGFSPATATVQSGESVTFVNNSGSTIEPASGPHPTHTENPELNAGDIEPGASKTVTLTATGTWSFHNHYDHVKNGTITVE